MSIFTTVAESIKKFLTSDYNWKYVGYCDPTILIRNQDLSVLNDLSDNGSIISDNWNTTQNRNDKSAQ